MAVAALHVAQRASVWLAAVPFTLVLPAAADVARRPSQGGLP